jgi:pentatricopeptide repeat protein
METYILRAMKSRMYVQVIRSFERYISLSSQAELSIVDKSVTTTMLNSYMDALIHMGYYVEAENAASYFMSTPDLIPDRQTYFLLFRLYTLSMNIRKARTLLMEMRDNNLQLDKQMIHTVLYAEGRLAINLDSVDLIAEVLSYDNIEKPDTLTYSIIIGAYLRCGRTDRAKQVLDLMNERGVQPNHVTYIRLIEHQARKGGLQGVEDLLSSMTIMGLKPGIQHIRHLVVCKLRHERMTLDYVSTLCHSYDTIPDIRLCNVVLHHLFKHPFHLRDLEAHFRNMKSLEITPNAETFNILLGEYQRKNRIWTKPAKLINQQWQIDPTLVDPPRVSETFFNLVVRGKADKSSNNYEGPLRLVWNETTLTSLAASLAKKNNYAKIIDIHEEVRTRDSKFDLWYSRVIFDALLKGSYYKQCEEILDRLMDSDAFIDQHFGRLLSMELCRWRYRRNEGTRESVLKAMDMFLRFADANAIGITEKWCNRIAVTCLDCQSPRLAANVIEARLMQLDKESDIRMSSWLLLMKAYSRKEFSQPDMTGTTLLRQCVERALRALNERNELPSKAFMGFLHHLSEHKFHSSRDRQFYAKEHLQLFQSILKAPRRRQTKGRQYLTRANILRWVNVLEPDELNEALYLDGLYSGEERSTPKELCIEDYKQRTRPEWKHVIP